MRTPPARRTLLSRLLALVGAAWLVGVAGMVLVTRQPPPRPALVAGALAIIGIDALLARRFAPFDACTLSVLAAVGVLVAVIGMPQEPLSWMVAVMWALPVTAALWVPAGILFSLVAMGRRHGDGRSDPPGATS